MIDALVNGFGAACLWMGLVAMLVVAGLAIWLNMGRLSRAVKGKVKGMHLVALALLGAPLTIYGVRKGRITYPYTDYETRYLTDAGSYVTNDFVHVNFNRIIAPSSAPFYLTYRQVDSTNDMDWVVYIETTFAEFACPSNVPFANATNYDWLAYTTWTPGPTVQTNGVWHSYWGKDKMLHTHFIPIRSSVRVDNETIATPKSKREDEQ